MARDTRLNIDVTATDRASGDLDRIAGKARDLEDPISIDVDADVGGASRDLGGLSSQLEGLGAGGAAAGLLAFVEGYADAALSAQTIADLTGTSVERASALSTVFQQTAQGDANDLLDIILQMNETLSENPELAAQLGVEYDASKPAAESFIEIVDALNASQLSQNEKVRIMAQLFGEEGVRQVGRMITEVGSLSDAIEEIPDAALITDADVARAREFKDQWNEILLRWQEFQRIAGGPAAAGLVQGTDPSLVNAGLVALGGPLAPALVGAGESVLRGAGVPTPGGTPLAPDDPRQLAFQHEQELLASRAAAQYPSGTSVTVINPPGTPTTVVNDTRRYGLRNYIR